MRIFLHGTTDFAYWLTAPYPPLAADRVGSGALTDCEPTRHSVDYTHERFPFLPMPLHVCTSSKRLRPIEGAVKHLATKRPDGKAYCRIGNGIFAAGPELCFVQLGQTLSFHELVLAGNVLCGTFFLSPSNEGRLEKRRPLTTKRRLGAFLRANPGLWGAKKAREALRWVVEGAASPPEAFLAMIFGLPFRYGGFQIAGLKINKRITPSRKAQRIAHRATLVPDILIPDAKIAIEYDSTTEHADAPRLTRDAQKRLALEADGYKVVTVTARQLGSCSEMERIATEVYHARNLRLRPQSRDFEAQQALLFAIEWSLGGYWAAPPEKQSLAETAYFETDWAFAQKLEKGDRVHEQQR
ncbi:hypothetical protein [uncultured Adlercreutzia sp.]|uniref:hypothetical protein n=1 Tax=uncultured Adlercreutzia sp. TaxID=875803 RepID=UPI0025DE4BDF|nr:hypothetical protein [uncultured Adlercreutzia sp.]